MLNFPASPTIGQQYPASPVDGVNIYKWDGEKWTVANNNPPGTLNPLMDGAVSVGVSQSFSREDHRHPSDTSRLAVAGGQTTTGGFRFTGYSLTLTGTVTPNAYNGNYQIGSNVGAFTLAAPANECAIDLMIGNSATAGAITFSGFTVGAGKTGDALTTTNGHWFIISIRRMGGISTYVIKALQ